MDRVEKPQKPKNMITLYYYFIFDIMKYYALRLLLRVYGNTDNILAILCRHNLYYCSAAAASVTT
jgi:hypothetical protein